MDSNSTESELESFRQQWRQEVKQRTQTQPATRTSQPSQSGPGRPPPSAGPSRPTGSNAEHHEHTAHVYHDLPDKEEYLKLGNASERSKATEHLKEPRTALEHYERAVEREGQGNLGDSVMHYRRAFKLDPSVHQAYRNKHHPPVAPTSKAATQPQPAAPQAAPSSTAPTSDEPRKQHISELLEAFSQLSIPPAEPETDLSPPPPCPIANIPGEILGEIFFTLAVRDVAAFARLAQVCKRFAYLVMTDDRIWKRVTLGSEIGFGAMHYRYACDVQGFPLLHSLTLPSPLPFNDLTPSHFPTYRNQFRHRPRLRFNGCYISTVNYARPGASSESRFTWTPPVQIVTYYRYLRFFRDGTVISLLTTTEPGGVVHHLTKENMRMQEREGESGQRRVRGQGSQQVHQGQGQAQTSVLPNAVVMKDALAGRWRLSGPLSSAVDAEQDDDANKGPGEYTREPLSSDPITGAPQEEEEGDVLIETEGVLPKYMWKMQFALGSAGRKDGTRNNKLSWKGFWSYNRLTDDWGEFGLKNDRAFYWSRVRSYGA